MGYVNHFMQNRSQLFYNIIQDLFVISLIAYLVLLWLDSAFSQYVSDFFSLNIILAIVLGAGILTAGRKVKGGK